MMTSEKMKFLIILTGILGSSLTAWSSELAKVNGKSISEKDLEAAIGGLNEGQRKNILKDEASRKQILNSVIDQELIVQEGEREKLDQDQQYKDAVATFRKQYLTNRVLEKSLANQLTDKAAKKYYDTHKKNKFSTDQVHALHILVSDEKEAQEILKKAKEPGADFQALAEEHSKDPTAKNNRGDLGYFTRDRMVAEFTNAAFDAEEGEIVGPVKTAYGYHIIKVVNKKFGKPLEYDEVELRVKNELRQELIQQYLAQLKKKQGNKIEILKN